MKPTNLRLLAFYTKGNLCNDLRCVIDFRLNSKMQRFWGCKNTHSPNALVELLINLKPTVIFSFFQFNTLQLNTSQRLETFLDSPQNRTIKTQVLSLMKTHLAGDTDPLQYGGYWNHAAKIFSNRVGMDRKEEFDCDRKNK